RRVVDLLPALGYRTGGSGVFGSAHRRGLEEAGRSRKTMDFRVDKLAQIRSLPRPEDGIRAVAQHAPQAEALAAGIIGRTRPYWTWVYYARRRLATTSVILLTLWLFLHVTFGANGMVIYRQKRAELQSLRTENEHLQTENSGYQQSIQSLR